ncbi:aminopeptidase N [Alcanivorax hongdengensis A-11-3]|uniref:Aminopeptidase N n=1 Tax=Alcanivorax hongdengensis A-11-3 TaxID=1177179 RepID=L0WHG2_9GAMM|nr:aminopeptidase N [Alcanivorax hongdengensis]EKF75280.1 aminopeptidase N [Alcanivorax hongdengensis A-11-3]
MEGANTAITTTRLADYQPPVYRVEQVTLDVDIHPGQTRVTSELQLQHNPDSDQPAGELVLNGEALVIESLNLDGETLTQDSYHYDGHLLTVRDLPAQCVLTSVVTIEPEKNTALEGLYQSNGMVCTQCEAEGFRRITFFPDRPDVLARFTTTVHADKATYPLLLSNGNPVDWGEEGTRHWVTWDDPFPKPCYLFALVAGDLACLEDSFNTASGRPVALRLYAEHRDLDKLDHAMQSLKNAMRWDEQTYGREYDLDIYMIVAVSHFNMGAMENKGLNIFNTACVLAHPDTTTDAGFQRVESVVAHEYFHNWSGNRVTCRDWFQLSLKEGFTVFRDQSFSADMNSAAVKRVEDVDFLVNHQFPEDQGPMAHPVRPAEYQKIDNFYTLTIYEKGAEIVRMQYNLLGPEAFRRASDRYFEQFDGQAVTCDDFVACMEAESGLDLSQFKRWYSQAGTPVLTVTDEYHEGQYTLHVRQHTPATPGQPDKAPLVIPVKLALLDSNGQAVAMDEQGNRETVVIVDQSEQSFRFAVPEAVTPSLLRGFSAPVVLDYPYTEAQLATLLAHDSDGYCRWNAAQRLYFSALDRLVGDPGQAQSEALALKPVLERVIERAKEDPAQAALLLTLPTEVALGDRHSPLDPRAVHQARRALTGALGQVLEEQWQAQQQAWQRQDFSMEGDAIGGRQMRLLALGYLAAAGSAGVTETVGELFGHPLCMTEELGALRLLVHHGLPGADQALADFAARWQGEALVMDQWFAVQATCPGEDTVSVASALLDHPAFEWTLPNRVRALVGTLVNANPVAFHAADGQGYRFFCEALARLDAINPQVAARLANGAARLRRLEPQRQAMLEKGLQGVQQKASANLSEVLSRILTDRS